MSAGERYTDTQLSLKGSAGGGARIGYVVAPRWSVYLQGSYARSRLHFSDTVTVFWNDAPPSSAASRRSGPAWAAVGTLELARSFALGRTGTELEVSAGGGVQHLSLERFQVTCAPGPLVDCAPSDPWEESYDVPSLAGGLSLRRPVSRTVALEARSSLLLGRVNTESFKALYAAPEHQALHSMQASVGLSWRP